MSDFVLEQEDAQQFPDLAEQMAQTVLPGYRREGKNYMTLAVGCTGGHHRSVAMAEALAVRLGNLPGVDVTTAHRDIEKD